MRVGIFTESYAPILNGVSTSVATLSRLLREMGHEPTIVAPRAPGYTDTETVLRLASWSWRFYPGFPFAWPPIGPFAAQTDRLELDVVHTQHPFGIGQHGRRAARRRGIPHVSTFHTHYHDYTHYFPLVPPAVARAWLTWYLRRFYAACDAVIVPSAETGRRLARTGVDPASLTVIPTGVPPATPVPPDAAAQVRSRWEIPADAPLVLYVGRIAWEKNLRLLIDAFVALPGSPWLLFVGGGPDTGTIEQAVREAGVTERTRFAGPIPREELGPIYTTATVFAFPSGTETQGLVLAEAQSYGLPCVAVDAGGAPEFVRHGVDALVTSLEVPDFRDAIQAILADPALRARLSAEARVSPLRWTPETMAERILEVYVHAGEQRRGKPGARAARP